MRLAIALLLLLAFVAVEARAETFCSCATDSGTAGTFKNSECENTLGVPRIAAVSWCDDFEDTGYTAQTGSDSWTDACTTGGVSARGGNSLWAQRYGGTAAGCGWSHGDTFSVGTSPCDLRVSDGSPCGGGNCPCGDECEPAGWLTGDPLEAGNSACIGILRANDIDDLFPAATEPSDPLAGSNSLVEIVQTGATNGLWQNGSASFNDHTFAISKIVAFPSDIASSGILDWPWKGDQCGADNHCTDTWLGSENGYSTNIFPFAGTSIYSLDDCSGARTGATYVVGSSSNVSCNGSQFRVESVVNYDRSIDWPYGQAGLVQVFYRAYGTSSTEMRIMFTPLGGSRLTLLHITGLDTSGASGPSPYNPNAYANANQGGGETPTSRDTGRIMDNLLIQSWTSGTAPADVLAAMPTASEMQFAEAEPGPSIAIDSITPSDTTPAFNTAIDVEVAYTADGTTGTITCDVDCENDGGYEDGSDTGASPQTITGVCPYTSSGAKTIGVRCQDTGPTASDTDTEGVTVDSATLTTGSPSASPDSGDAPLNDVDFTIGSLGGTAIGDVSISVDCTTNGSFDASFDDSSAPWTIADACDYSTANSYTATVRATRSGVTASPDLTVGVTVSEAEAPVYMQILAPPP